MKQRTGLGGSGKVLFSTFMPGSTPGMSGESHTPCVCMTTHLSQPLDSSSAPSALPLPFPAASPASLMWHTSHQHSHKRGISLHLPYARHHLPAQDREGPGPVLPSDPPLLSRGENTSSLKHIPKEPPSPALSSVMAPAGRLRQHNSCSIGTARRLRHKGSEKTRGVPPISSKCKGLFRVPATTSSSSRTTQSENQFLRRK